VGGDKIGEKPELFFFYPSHKLKHKGNQEPPGMEKTFPKLALLYKNLKQEQNKGLLNPPV
jgi:hypothetical protein